MLARAPFREGSRGPRGEGFWPVPDEVAPRSITAPVALGRYRLGPVLGRGATAWVYRARDLATGADVAVKAIPCELGLSARVGAEIRAAT